MTGVVWVFAVLTAVIHIAVFLGEVVFFERPVVHQRVFSVPADDVPAVRLWAFGVGFYNLFLGCGMIAGVALWALGYETVGRTLVVYHCVFLLLSGVVLLVADRMALGRPRGAGVGGAIGQGVPPLVALLAAVV